MSQPRTVSSRRRARQISTVRHRMHEVKPDPIFEARDRIPFAPHDRVRTHQYGCNSNWRAGVGQTGLHPTTSSKAGLCITAKSPARLPKRVIFDVSSERRPLPQFPRKPTFACAAIFTRAAPVAIAMSPMGLVSRVAPVHTAMRNCTRDEGRPFEVDNQVLISSHRKLLSSKARVVNVAEKPEQDSGRHDWERRTQVNRR